MLHGPQNMATYLLASCWQSRLSRDREKRYRKIITRQCFRDQVPEYGFNFVATSLVDRVHADVEISIAREGESCMVHDMAYTRQEAQTKKALSAGRHAPPAFWGHDVAVLVDGGCRWLVGRRLLQLFGGRWRSRSHHRSKQGFQKPCVPGN